MTDTMASVGLLTPRLAEAPLVVPFDLTSGLAYAALHECGHAAVAHALGVRVSGVAAKDAQPGELAGICLVDPDGGSMADQAMISLGGICATRLGGVADDWSRTAGAEHDIVFLSGFMRCIPVYEWSMLAPMTVSILRDRWNGVTALTVALMAQGELYDEDVVRVLSGAR